MMMGMLFLIMRRLRRKIPRLGKNMERLTIRTYIESCRRAHFFCDNWDNWTAVFCTLGIRGIIIVYIYTLVYSYILSLFSEERKNALSFVPIVTLENFQPHR